MKLYIIELFKLYLIYLSFIMPRICKSHFNILMYIFFFNNYCIGGSF